MNIVRTLILMTLVIALAAPLHAADTAQSLYLSAGKEERAGSMAKAREIYESIIDRFPESEFAVKANDRLLALPAAKAKTGSEPSPALLNPFSPPAAKPLPAEPLLRRGVEAARMKAKADVTAREEFARLKRADEVREGNKQSRSRYSEKEAAWREAAERKVVEEFGMTHAEIAAKLEGICREAGVTGECSEESLLKLAPAAR